MTKTFCRNCLEIISVDNFQNYPYKKRINEKGKKATYFFCSNKCIKEFIKVEERYKVLGIKE